MKKYNYSRPMRGNDRRNLIPLRRDLHFLFDAGSYVYAPKNGTMRLHFISECRSYMQYHNSPFSTAHIHVKFLYARFAWGIFKHVVWDEPTGDDARSSNQDGSDQGPDTGPPDVGGSRDLGKKRKRESGRDSREPPKLKKTGDLSSGASDSDDDPFFSFFGRLFLRTTTISADFSPADPDGIAPPYDYETLHWYPGVKKVEVRKGQWMTEHPNIRETRGTKFAESLSPGPSSDEG
jgi:hypothetical protein